jgi:hypothetical protein
MLEMSNTASKAYEYQIEVSMTDAEGKQIEQPYITVQSDAILSKEQVQSAAEDMVAENYGEDVNATFGNVTSAWINTANT